MADRREASWTVGAKEPSLGDLVRDQSHSHPQASTRDWASVAGIVLGAALLGLALILGSWVMAAIGGVLVVVCGIAALAGGIMQHTEDYEGQRH